MGTRLHPPDAILTIIFFLAIMLAGCSPGERPVGPEGDLAAIGPTVDPEGCIRAILKAYVEYGSDDALSRYAGVLHPDYRFHFQPGDVTRGERPYLDREEDIAVTAKIFANATFLFLDISEGEWYRLWNFDNEPCEGCFTTTRKYAIIAQFGEYGKIFRGTDIITIIAVPDPDFPDRFVILAIFDIDDD